MEKEALSWLRSGLGAAGRGISKLRSGGMGMPPPLPGAAGASIPFIPRATTPPLGGAARGIPMPGGGMPRVPMPTMASGAAPATGGGFLSNTLRRSILPAVGLGSYGLGTYNGAMNTSYDAAGDMAKNFPDMMQSMSLGDKFKNGLGMLFNPQQTTMGLLQQNAREAAKTSPWWHPAPRILQHAADELGGLMKQRVAAQAQAKLPPA